jgi:threonine 3-dehydrogenase
VENLVELGEGRGLDVTMDMSGNQEAIVNALRSLRKGGTFVAFGIPPRPIAINLANDVILKGRRILGIVGRHMFRTWETMQRLLDEKKLDPTPIITHRLRLADWEKGLQFRGDREQAVGKVILSP